MLQRVSDKLREAELKLELRFPKKLFDFIRKLESPEVIFGEEEWTFPIVTDDPDNPSENFIISKSIWFINQWNMNALVFAVGRYGDYLLALQDKNGRMLKQIFVLITESSEIKVFNTSLDKLIEYGPFDYMEWSDYYLKLEDGEVIRGEEMSD
ncbi:hypothetical protein MYP_388 [Sporocytophaga myxococcoides]|uniref:Knr4/Smi1-like domain-containing protein n=1 Tax=Sporocytophaga myxococcoides TaxID=153721 RepID=A0A098L991_9BACT|nr:hypothetical protein [Sporocytophaga myxococcoides]GAL83162.1 hypothetical protein MYP_388 [Sporocytophaga myxococcoides]